MKFHIPFLSLKAVTGASCAVAAALISVQAFAAVNPAVQQYARRAAAEGIVLLKNDNNALPLGQDGAQPVAFFGITQVQTFLVGYGSGGDVKPPYRVTLADALAKTDKIVPDKELFDTYLAWAKANPLRAGGWGNWPFYAPEMPITAEQIQAAAKRADTAVLMIGRAAGEDRECRLEPGSYYLTDAEKFLLKEVSGAFKKTVVLLNVGNVIDMAWVKDYKIDALMYVWQGGMETGNAIVDVLTGKETPSGKLASAIANTYEDYPSSSSFGNREFNNYTEDIYVGYRYFETFAPGKVLYPFGFGLSYTTFDIFGVTVNSPDLAKRDVTVKATVKNTGGKYSGREVVQVYCGAPQGKLGKPAKVLVAYAKTKALAPGEAQSFTFTIPAKDFASFDDSGVTGHQAAWVLEPGKYTFYVGNSSRAAKASGNIELGSLAVIEQLEPALAIASESVAFDRMKAVEQNDKLVAGTERVPVSKVDLPARVKERLPKAVPETGDKGIKLIDVKNGKNTLDEFVAQLTPVEIETLLRGDGGMGSRLGPAGNASVFGGTLQSVRDKGVPPIPTCDGPSGLRLSANASLLPIGSLLACTWNNDLIEAMYYQVGLEMEMNGVDCILGPGMNIHRNPLCGRNFEYYSEDPLLTGLMAAYMTRGIQKAGASTVPKHFALNNQETNRNANDSRCSERALREIYLRAFEICVKAGKPYNIMGSYNKVNSFWNYYNYDLDTTILRGQWGWTGSLMTDWWAREGASEALHVRNNAWRVRSQMDVLMPGDGPARGKDNSLLESYNQWVAAGRPDGIEAGITLSEMQRSAKNVLNFVMNSRTFRKAHSLPNTYKPGEDWFFVGTDAVSDVPQAADVAANGGKSGNELFKNAPTDITVNGEKIGFNPAVTTYYLPGIDFAAAKIEVATPAGVEKKITRNDVTKTVIVTAGTGPDARSYTIDFNAVSNGRPIQFIELDKIEIPTMGFMSIMAAESTIFLSQGLRTKDSQKDLSGSQNGVPIKDSDHAIFNATVGSVARYAVHCTKDGKYAVSLRVASGQANTLAQLAIELYLDGEIAATFNATSTGGDQNWIDTKSYPVEFKQGFHTLELRWKSDGLNVSRINLTSVN
ncbi:MAG: glycoside hydrolase family 3 C-terminal domain-containing protein [Lentisphaeria bacterium]|nr:glycoside hydrolase family 3 C-terminal domain-containing protein [Lentisphaeria bacterium]